MYSIHKKVLLLGSSNQGREAKNGILDRWSYKNMLSGKSKGKYYLIDLDVDES